MENNGLFSMDIQMTMIPEGGDLIRSGKDLKVIYGFENMPLLALWGGNKEQSTHNKRNPNEQNFDWWGNALMPNNPETQMNSATERVMHSVPLNSFGRLQIEAAIKDDLRFMKPFANVTVATEIIATDVLKINIKIIRPDNLEEKQFIFVWDKTKDELDMISNEYIPNNNQPKPTGLQYNLQSRLNS